MPESAVSSSPASEHSVYFDAPMMHIFTRKNKDDTANDDANRSDMGSSAEDANQPHDAAQADIDRQPSVTIAPDPIVDRHEDDNGDAVGRNNADEAQQLPSSKSSKGTSMSPLSDSGYASSTGQKDAPHSTSDTSTDMKPIPILWSDYTSDTERGRDQEDREGNRADDQSQLQSQAKRAASLRSFRSVRDHGDRESIRSTPASRRRRVSLSQGSFAAGAGTVGPAASPHVDESFAQRSKSAEAELTPKQRTRVQKANAKEGKRVAKVIKSEAKAERKAIEQTIAELADIQKMQKAAIREESKAGSAHAKALRTFHKEELEYLAARAKYERAQAELQSYENAREAAKGHASEIMDMLQEKNQEVEWLRAQKAADDRERMAKIKQLTGKS